MPATALQAFARIAGRPYDPATDRELIARFHQERDESAFASLVDKHGPMVLGVCRRRLKDTHAADDAFQATFLILARKAGAVRWQESLGGWLYRVATHVCRKAVARSAKRGAVPLPADAEPAAPQPAPPSELSGVLDDELKALPPTYRDPIILCHLQGLTVEEAAKALGVSDGQLRGRLFRGREKLRERLSKRGVALSVSALVVSLTAGTAQAVPTALRTAASAVSAPVSETVLTLTREVLFAMSRTKFNLLAASAVLVAALLTAGVVAKSGSPDQQAAKPADAAKPNPAAVREPIKTPAPTPRADDDDDKKPDEKEKLDRREGKLKSIDATGNKLVLLMDEDKFSLPVDVGAKTTITVARRVVKLVDLKEGMSAVVTFRGTEKEAMKVEGSWPGLDAATKAVDADKHTITIKTEEKNGFEFGVTLPVAPDAQVMLEGVPVGLADLTVGGNVNLEFSVDKKTVEGISVWAETGLLPGVVKATDPAKKTVTLSVRAETHRDHRDIELSFETAADCVFRVNGKDVKLADLTARMPVRCRLAADRRTVTRAMAGPVPAKEKDDDDDK